MLRPKKTAIGRTQGKGILLFEAYSSDQRRIVLSREKETQEARNLEAYVKELRRDMDRTLAELKLQIRDIRQEASKTVTKRPMLALGVAFVAGMAIGIALSKSSD